MTLVKKFLVPEKYESVYHYTGIVVHVDGEALVIQSGLAWSVHFNNRCAHKKNPGEEYGTEEDYHIDFAPPPLSRRANQTRVTSGSYG